MEDRSGNMAMVARGAVDLSRKRIRRVYHANLFHFFWHGKESAGMVICFGEDGREGEGEGGKMVVFGAVPCSSAL